MSYSLPRKIFVTFEEVFGKEKAELLSSELEKSIEEKLRDTNQGLKITLKDELKDELATKGDVQVIQAEMKLLDFKLNIVIGIAILSLTFFNPALLAFLTKVFKL